MKEKVKQVIVVRQDLNMRKGKIAAQVAHASLKVILDQMKVVNVNHTENNEAYSQSRILKIKENSPLEEWIDGIFTKVVVSVDTEKEIFALKIKADSLGIVNALITDAGKTEFNNVPTITCIAIGPDMAEKVDEITGHCKLM